jgi:integrase
MPLRLVKRGKIYYVRGTVAGESVYETTGTANRKDAEGFRQKRESQLYERRVHGERAVVTFEEAALSYVEAVAPREQDRTLILKLADHFGQKRLIEIDQAAVDKACAELLKADAAPSTKIRQVITPLTSIMNHAARRKWCDAPKFERPEVAKGKTRWLTPTEALALEAAAAPHLKPLIRFLLCTGARLSEALELDWSTVSLQGARCTFVDTKNGKDRTAALPPAAIAALSQLAHRAGPVFLWPKRLPTPKGEEPRIEWTPYADNDRNYGGQIKTAFTAACRRAGLGEWIADEETPDEPVFVTDVTPHVCRHTWASYFYALTKDPFKLRNEGGWSTVGMVERYAHLMPDEMIGEIALIWGASHPSIGKIPGAESVQPLHAV